MKRTLNILLLMAMCVSLCEGIWAQEEKKDDKQGKSNTQEKLAKLSEADMKMFQPLLKDYMDAESSQERDKALEVMLKAMEDYSEKNKVSSPVADDAAWAKIFTNFNNDLFAKKKVYATGRIKTETFILPRNGEYFAYEYSFYVPKAYTPNKSWPVLLCLHDKEAKNLGKGYIQKLWQSSKESKALCEEFIIVAPHLPKRLPKKKMRYKIRGKNERIETTAKSLKWFNSYHLLSMVMPLVEIRKQFNCDPSKIFIEGVGYGADSAATLAALTSGKFAGLICRHGKLKEPKLLTGLQFTPSMVVIREDSPDFKGSVKEFSRIVSEATQGDVKYTSLTVEKVPNLGLRRLPPKLLGNQPTDPCIEANAKIAEFVKAHSLDPNPKEIRITSNHRGFINHNLVRVTSHDIPSGNLLDCIVKFDREKNTVELSGKNYFRVSLFLNDTVLDLSKPVQVLVNGEQVDARVPDRSPSRMLQYFRSAPSDFNQARTCLILVPEFSLEKKKEEKKEEKKDAKQDGEAKDEGNN